MKKTTYLFFLLIFLPVLYVLAEQSGLDQFGLPPRTKANISIFYPEGSSGASSNSWQRWDKPRGVSMVYMMCIGGGGGGGGGFSRVAGGDGGGGGGGGTGGVTRFLCPALMVPDVLYALPGRGGIGGVASSTGTQGGISYVVMGPYPSGTMANAITDFNVFLRSGAVQALSGGAGEATRGGGAGAGSTIDVIGNANRGAYMAFWAATVGLTGFAGGAHTGAAGTAASNVLSDGVAFSGGAGGAGSTGTDFNGGDVTGAGYFYTILGGSVTAADLNGGAGYTWAPESGFPMMSTGGAGGASKDSGSAGNGGNGGFPGSGGGGGGAGVTGGTGGAGGDGCVIIISW